MRIRRTFTREFKRQVILEKVEKGNRLNKVEEKIKILEGKLK